MALTLALLDAGAIALALWAVTSVSAVTIGTGMAVRIAVLAVCALVAFYYCDLYDLRRTRSPGACARRLLPALGVAVALAFGAGALVPAARADLVVVVAGLVIASPAVLALRWTGHRMCRAPQFTERVLVLGEGAHARAIVTEIAAHPHMRYVTVAAEPVASDGDARGSVASRVRLETMIDRVRPDRIVLAVDGRHRAGAVWRLLGTRARGIPVEDGFELYERLTGKLAIDSAPPSSFLFAKGFSRSRRYLESARVVSLVVAAVALVLTLPLFLVIALAVRLDSPGPVLFRQARVGLHGRRFELIKFRTMRPTTGAHSEWARDNEARITRVGRVLRTFRLDELPQLVNIVRGDMSFVGPRPHPMSNVSLFTEAIPYYPLRTVVRPGVTGWAQVRYGYANGLDEEIEKMRYDLYYIKHASVLLDLRVLVDTVKVVLYGSRAPAPHHPAPALGHRAQDVA